MVKARITERDPKLVHQIDLRFRSGRQSITQVFCNCRSDALGEIGNKEDPWPIYNDPRNHNQMREPFVPGTSTAKEYDVD